MKEHRKRFWIHPFQTGLLIRIVLYCLAYQMVTWAYVELYEQISTGYAATGAKSAFRSSPLLRTFLVLLTLIPPLTLDAVRFAHRLVGPLYRFRKTIQAVAAGEPVSLVQLRKGDMLLDFQDDFNEMLKYLEQQGFVLRKAPGASVNAETPETVGSMGPAAQHPGS